MPSKERDENYSSIPKHQRCNRCSLGMDKWFHHTFYNGCNYWPIMGLKLIHVSKRAPAMAARWQTPLGNNPFVNTNQKTILSATTDDNFGILVTLFLNTFCLGCNIFFGNEGSRTFPNYFGPLYIYIYIYIQRQCVNSLPFYLYNRNPHTWKIVSLSTLWVCHQLSRHYIENINLVPSSITRSLAITSLNSYTFTQNILSDTPTPLPCGTRSSTVMTLKM